MRNVVKGGVWKNVEDEILKAAVMKYGKNQWARIASLLTRKTAKQCKARWTEWLDPSVKKTEWSREEEERLLHLAKIMPTQWRTIAPLVGRTPAQCLEHYEKLLDAAQGKEDDYEGADDPRRLRPGEIDPFPETKPARPDAVDMDEDEKEMLNEARARLANTKGKKAKRKARERQLEEARRLASLQKRRELRAAGIPSHEGLKKIRGLNYNVEVAFEKKVPAGFFDTTEEDMRPPESQTRGSRRLDELEGKRRIDVENEKRRDDARKQRKRKEQDLPAAIMQINNLNDPDLLRKRTKLNLPAPQLNEAELEAVLKAGVTGTLEPGMPGATPRGMTPGFTPQRTPARTPSQANIMNEAQNLLALTQSSAPLLGGENKPLHESDFSGALPKPKAAATPNVMATPARTPAGVGLTPGRTPLRDDLGINTASSVESARAEKMQAMALRNQLKAGLMQLPKPVNEYEMVAPEVPTEEEEAAVKDDLTADRSELDALRAKLEKEREAEEALLRSQAVQRGLPRPTQVISNIPSTGRYGQAEEMINAEMVALLQHDAVRYPIPGGAQPRNAPDLLTVTYDQVQQARLILEEEVATVRQQMGHSEISAEEIHAVEDEVARDELYYISSRNTFIRASTANRKDSVEALQTQLDAIRANVAKDFKKASRVEQKLKILLGGYQNRQISLSKRIDELAQELSQSSIELECFRQLREQESKSLPLRLEQMQREVNDQREREHALQTRYANLMAKRDNLLAAAQTSQAVPASL